MALKIQNFPPVELHLSDRITYGEIGVLETIAGIVDNNTGPVQFKALFSNPNRLLNTGNSGVVVIPRPYKNVLVVPAAAALEL